MFVSPFTNQFADESPPAGSIGIHFRVFLSRLITVLAVPVILGVVILVGWLVVKWSLIVAILSVSTNLYLFYASRKENIAGRRINPFEVMGNRAGVLKDKYPDLQQSSDR